MMFLLPFAALGLGTAAAFLKDTLFGGPPSNCGALTPEERMAIDGALSMGVNDLLSAASAEGKTQAMVVADLHAYAQRASAKGCQDDARRLELKARAVADPMVDAVRGLFGPAQQAPALPPGPGPGLPGPGPGLVDAGPGAPLTGAYVAPTSAAPGARLPFGTPAFGSPTAAAMPPPAPVAPPNPARPIIARGHTRERTWVRPEPRPWDDRQGRFGFSIPAAYPVGVVAFAPAGWAEVVLNHPTDGQAGGFIELAKLAPAQASPGISANGAATGNCPGGVCPVPGPSGGRPAAPMGGGGGGGAGLFRQTNAQKARMKASSRRAKRAAQARAASSS